MAPKQDYRLVISWRERRTGQSIARNAKPVRPEKSNPYCLCSPAWARVARWTTQCALSAGSLGPSRRLVDALSGAWPCAQRRTPSSLMGRQPSGASGFQRESASGCRCQAGRAGGRSHPCGNVQPRAVRGPLSRMVKPGASRGRIEKTVEHMRVRRTAWKTSSCRRAPPHGRRKSYKTISVVPPAGLEPTHPAPEAGALSN
jgi:hypothetical protein